MLLMLRSMPLRLAMPRKVPGLTSPMRLRLRSRYSRDDRTCMSLSRIVCNMEVLIVVFFKVKSMLNYRDLV